MSSRQYPFEQYASRRLYYSFDFLPNSKDVVYSANTSGQFNVWRQNPPTGTVREEPRQLTGFVEWSVRHVKSHPSGKWVLAYADKDGDENYQLFRVDAENGWQEQLVYDPKVRHEWGIDSFSRDGRFLAYSSNERNPRDMDVWTLDVSSGKTRPILSGGGVFNMGYWSPEAKWVTAVETLSTDDLNTLLVNTKTGEKKNMTPHANRAISIPGPWSPNGDGFYLMSNQDREFTGLAYKPVAKPEELKWLETPKADVESLALSPNGRFLAWVENVDGYNTVRVRDFRTGKLVGGPVKTNGALLPGWFDNITLLSFSPDSKRLVFLLTKPTMPAEIHVLELPKMDVVKYTDGFVGHVPESSMVMPKVVHYDSFDRKIPAFLYKPKTLKPSTKAPGVIVVHGGPESQERPQFAYAGLYQYLLNHGVGVLALNIRGSTGYGKKYQRLIHHDWGGDELRDIDHAAKYFKSLDWVDPGRLAIFGGSFGGFAVLSASTRLPEHWRVAVDIFGPSNLVSFAKAVPEHWKPFMADLVGDAEKEVEFLMKRSPITYIDQLKCPILIIQGANDPRVVKPESDQVVEKLRSSGREVEYKVFDDEGHGFTKQKNEFTTYKLVTEFLGKHLLNN